MEFLFGIIILALDVWAIFSVWNSGASGGARILWTLGIIILPVIGFLVWLFAGPKGRTAVV